MASINDFLASVHYLNHPYLSGLSALTLLFIGVFVLLKNKKSKTYRAFFWFNFTISVWFFGNALSMANFENVDLAIFWWSVGYTGAIFISTAYYDFYLSYFKKNRKILYFILTTAILEIVCLWFVADIKSSVYTLPDVGLVINTVSGFFYLLTFGMVKYVVISTVIAIYFLIESKKEKNHSRKTQLKWMSILFFILLFGASEWLVTFNIPLHIAWIVVPIFSVFFAYAILKYHLMDISVVIKKAFFYSIGIALVSGTIVGISFLGSWFANNIPGFQFWIVPAVAGFFAFMVGNIFWQKSKQVEKAYAVEKQAREELQNLGEVKDQFILATQHHLRTPLSIIKGYLSTVLESNSINSEDRQHLDRTLESTDRLIGTVNELLDVAQIEVGKKTLDIKPINIKKLIEEIIGELSNEAKEKNIEIEIFPNKDWPDVMADKEKIKIALTNLIDNAVKYTKEGEIIIMGKKTKDCFQISIKDTGIGVDPKKIKTIFSKYFERGKEAKKIFTTGRGIGLFIAANIIKAHNGKIYAKSQGVGKGSEFIIELPIK
ncbi:MAG TPA: sensor histidine kinase [Candidatus Moranbacteria bacterium]|nr:sensor histidine kinase [Candidatus Moranbacteria bacterium]